jgi:hypothetical protein
MGSNIPPGLREIARNQCGVITRGQALEAGMSPGEVGAKIRRGGWRLVYDGVYATEPGPVRRAARLWAAVLYAGRGAELSFETAGEVHGLTDEPSVVIHVSVPAERRVRELRGLMIHRSVRAGAGRFPPGTLPVTTVEDTILDLAELAGSPQDASDWVTHALRRDLTSGEALLVAAGGRKKLRWRRHIAKATGARAGRPSRSRETEPSVTAPLAIAQPSATTAVPG